MVLADISFHNEHSEDYLIRIDVMTREVYQLGESPNTGDTLPRWSPTGEWIAFGRAALHNGARTWGTQLWLMHPDGTQARPLVTDPKANLGAFDWRPDGGAISYVRLPFDELADPHPELWVVSLDSGETVPVAGEAIMPDWLP